LGVSYWRVQTASIFTGLMYILVEEKKESNGTRTGKKGPEQEQLKKPRGIVQGGGGPKKRGACTKDRKKKNRRKATPIGGKPN